VHSSTWGSSARCPQSSWVSLTGLGLWALKTRSIIHPFEYEIRWHFSLCKEGFGF
jgi:hypothetical protein